MALRTPLKALCSWTPLGDSHPPVPPYLQILATPLHNTHADIRFESIEVKMSGYLESSPANNLASSVVNVGLAVGVVKTGESVRVIIDTPICTCPKCLTKSKGVCFIANTAWYYKA